ncbi:sensor histidine kinase [Latilactobacillus sakei]|uniref:sensor histidine kinase n=1 Tax=Latilactobacillus sakei TaxID=1599 RepID=UPI000B96A7C5|nr:sensor histidine kinase [Latilactobacillus sakei]AST83105.1 hypothetical protein LBS_00720 [Latilactobacillus sakei]AWZ43835.1 sensor histidine kinase [Latilactobacillus sakei]MCE8502487.1 sensor histidine kinase [Latilactobacillus sakei]QGL61002.1 hypothetical protein GJ664_06740 [Latilactobacillus sakei]QVQ49513.1 sensor histidine kinase [Latilactobacillus sakei subsp. sakei]
MSFFKRYIAMPQQYGLFPYVWLLFLLFPIAYAFPFKTLRQQVIIGLVLIFVIAYRNSYVATTYRPFWLLLQMVVSAILAVIVQALYLSIYTAWVFGSIPMRRRSFWGYYGAYMLSILVPTLFLYYYYGGQMGRDDWVGLAVYGLFCVLSPFAAGSIQRYNRKNRQLIQTNQRLTEIIKQNERQRIARDLHDNLGQSFSMITLKAEYARKLLAKKPDAVPEQLLAIEQASRQNLKMVRDIVAGLRQTTIAEELINQERNLSVAGIILLTKDENQIEGLPQSNQQVLAQCLHEAVTNIIRYSHATECYVTFAQSATTFQMTIQDNGRGLKKADQFKSHGMAGMRERLEVIQGELTVDGRHGTTLMLTIPIVTEAKND